MKSNAYTIGLLLCLLLLCGPVCIAQDKEPLRADWLAKDVEVLERYLPSLKQNEPITIPALETVFETPISDNDLGFGGATFTISKPGGYTHLTVSGFIFNGNLGYYTIALRGSSSWPMIRTVLIDTWKRTSDLEIAEGKDGIFHDRQFPNVIADYKKAVAAQLGELSPVDVPRHLKAAYDELVSLGNFSVVGNGRCGLGGSTPLGKEAIDAIAKAGRVDLISNILRGYNPGGRVYAALALFAMQRKGTSLPPDLQHTMDLVRTSPLSIETCSGCFLTEKTAQEIFNDWHF